MNTKWEEELAKTLMEITAKYQTWNYAMNLYSPLKAFIKDQITEAEKRGYEKGQIDQTYLMVNTLRDINKGNHSPKGSDMPCCSFCKCNGQPVEVVDGLMHVAHTWHDGDCHDLKCQCHQSASKASQLADPITKAQQEIAGQIIEGIPHSLGGVEGESVYAFQLTKLKEKLRKKYIKKKSIT